MIMNSYATFHELRIQINFRVYEKYSEIRYEIWGTKIPDVARACFACLQQQKGGSFASHMGHCSVLSHTNWSTSGHDSTLCPGGQQRYTAVNLLSSTATETAAGADIGRIFSVCQGPFVVGSCDRFRTINVYPDGDYGMVEGQLYQDAFKVRDFIYDIKIV